MKTLYIILLTLLVLSASCKKEKDPWALDKSQNAGTMTAMLNGKVWETDIVTTNISTQTSSRVDIRGGVFVEGIERQKISIGSIDPRKEKQVIYNFLHMTDDYTGYPRDSTVCFSNYILKAYDYIEDDYLVLETADNYIKIDNYDPTNPRVKGSFQLTLYRTGIKEREAYQNMPDTLRFTKGQFDIVIQER